MEKIISKILFLLLTLSLFGCVNQPVNPSEKDSSGAYAGNWSGSLASTEEFQYYSGARFSCDKYDTAIALNIQDGIVNGAIGQGQNSLKFSTVIDTSGYFYTEIPTSSVFNVTPRSGPDIEVKAIFMVKGNLDAQKNNGKGTFTFAREDEKRGCTANFEVSK